MLEPGEVWAGDPVSVENRPVHEVPIAQAFRAFLTEPQLLPELAEIDGLPDGTAPSVGHHDDSTRVCRAGKFR